jgi:uncharacterized membrane protein
MRQKDKEIIRRPSANFGGLYVGLLFFCLSLTPSLLPRGYVVQGVASGLSIVTGYCLGTLGSLLYHKLLRKRGTPRAGVRYGILAVLAITAIAYTIAGMQWQQAVREATDAPPITATYPLLMIIIALGLATLLVLIGRGCRRLGRYFGRILGRHMPPKVATYGGGALAAILLIFIVNGLLINAIFGFINYSFGLANKGTPDGIHQPQAAIFSGSPASHIDWNSLGEKGREFVATTPSAETIAAFADQPTGIQPSRLYAGIASAETVNDRVKLLIAELNRTGASNRKAVLIAIPTGSGGINAKSVQSVEYIYGGNTTTLGIQYSYLPSWLSFLADQETARENGRVITEAVYAWWQDLDPASRPQLLMYGESLGTLGADGAFSGPSDMQNRMHGVVLAGPPNANELWSTIVAGRDEGTRAVLPTYNHGEVVRFSDSQTTFENNPPQTEWNRGRVAIIQHPSDPVVWAGLLLFVQKPDWLKEPRGHDVLPAMRWYPFVTGWQVALDLPFAFSATPGHGHRYDTSLVSTWLAVLEPGFTAEKSAELQRIIDAVR